MNNDHKKHLANFLFISFFLLQLLVFFLYVPCDTYLELIENNSSVFKLDKISWFALVLGSFLISRGSNKSILRIVLVAVTYSTINELTGLNNHLYSFEYPVFWSLMIFTGIYSYIKYQK